MTADLLQKLSDVLADLDEKAAIETTEEALASGDSPLAITRAGEAGMRRVGEYYEDGTYFLSGLIMAGEIFKRILDLVQPELENEISGEGSGRILVGTVAGDIHDIGKNLLTTALRGFGFAVQDLGVDVPAEHFVEHIRLFRPHGVGLSGLTSSSYESMRITIRELRALEKELGPLPIIIGGAGVDETVCRFTEADHWTTDAMEGIRILERILNEGVLSEGESAAE